MTELGIGSRVQHPGYGDGVVINVKKQSVMITFMNHGTKEIPQEYEGLKILDKVEPDSDLVSLWDIERTLEANAATASLIGLTLGATVDRRWFAFPAIVAGFLLQHALQGWCPPLPVFRRMGYRTSYEIDYERYALKILRGDFRQFRDGQTHSTSQAALQAVEK